MCLREKKNKQIAIDIILRVIILGEFVKSSLKIRRFSSLDVPNVSWQRIRPFNRTNDFADERNGVTA